MITRSSKTTQKDLVCGSIGEDTTAASDTSTEITETTTIVTTTTTEETTTKTTTTTTAAQKSLDGLTEVNEYDESKNTTYTLVSLDISIPQYWKVESSSENAIKFSNKPKDCESALLFFSCGNGTVKASEYDTIMDELQKNTVENHAGSVDNISKEAYNYDTGETRSVSDAYYTTDGITYFVYEDMNITSCRLHDSDITCDFNPYLQDLSFFTKKRGKGEYTHEYINEIDHFFTYCFNRYLAKKEDFYARESGIRAIYKAILA